MRVYKADWRGDDFYYTPQDLEWVDEEKTITTPKQGAIPRNKNGDPIVFGEEGAQTDEEYP